MSTNEGARKSGKFILVGEEADFAWTPRGGEKVLVPYVLATDLSQSEDCSPDTFFTGQPVFLFKKSFAPRVRGNEPGSGDGDGTSGVDERGNGGLSTGIHNGIAWGKGHSPTVFVNGIPVVRHLDEVRMNHKPGGG
jgi:hypothetical protein